MKEFIELTNHIVKEIIKIESSRKHFGEFLRKMSLEKINVGEEILEEKIIIPVEKIELNEIRVAGVDGGLVKKNLHGIDIKLSRAIGVIFSYLKNKLEKVEYYPSPIPTPIPNIIFDPYSELELELSCGMERQILEATIASEVIEKFKPEILLMHGSIIPHYTEKPSSQSLLYPTYLRMIETYKKLFQATLENKILLAGVVEDSRGTRFCEILSRKMAKNLNIGKRMEILLEKTRDTSLLSYVLDAKERTSVFRYSSNPEVHPILKDFGELANFFFSFYLKPVKFDRPIRIDMLSNKIKVVERLSSVLLSLAGHSRYGMPSVLIEADQRARLSERDLEMFYHDIANKIGNVPGILFLRREERPI